MLPDGQTLHSTRIRAAGSGDVPPLIDDHDVAAARTGEGRRGLERPAGGGVSVVGARRQDGLRRAPLAVRYLLGDDAIGIEGGAARVLAAHQGRKQLAADDQAGELHGDGGERGGEVESQML